MKSDQKNTHRHLFVPLISREQKHDDDDDHDDDQVKHKQRNPKSAPRADDNNTAPRFFDFYFYVSLYRLSIDFL